MLKQIDIVCRLAVVLLSFLLIPPIANSGIVGGLPDCNGTGTFDVDCDEIDGNGSCPGSWEGLNVSTCPLPLLRNNKRYTSNGACIGCPTQGTVYTELAGACNPTP